MSIKKDIVWRVGAIYFFVMAFAFIVIGRVLFLQLVEGEKWRKKAQTFSHRDIIIPANRGDICANDGRLLSCSLPFYELRMDFSVSSLTDSIFNANVDSLSLCLANFFGDKSKAKYKQKLLNARRNTQTNKYVLLNKKKLNFNELKTVSQFPLFRLGRNRGGFIPVQDVRRIQPHINLANRTIGYLIEDYDGKERGRVGIEGAYDDYLKGVDGIGIKQKISGRWLTVNQLEPKDGNDVITTIDVNYQDAAEFALLQQLEKYDANHGTAVLMEVKTGAIRAIANLGRDTLKGGYREKYNYAVGESSEPGSTFKLASIMTLLEDEYVELTDSIDTGDGEYDFYGETMNDSREGGFGKITVKEVFEKSSNIGIARLVNEHYVTQPAQFINHLYSFHLNEPLGIKIRGEGNPHIKYPNDTGWSGVSLPWMSIGYEIKQTPLQTLAFYNAIANNGKMVKPKFVEELQYHGKTIKKFDTDVIESMICSRKTLKNVKKMLEGVVERGTARKYVKNNNYKVAGKTGTALIANKNKGYSDKVYQASFVGYFPAEKPLYSCIVVIYKPNKLIGFYGNKVAGQVFKTIADKVYTMNYSMHPLQNDEINNDVKVPISLNGNKMDLDEVFENLNINVENKNINTEWVVSSRRDSVIKYQHRRIKRSLVPNVKGMGLKDAIYILENAGIEVSVKGFGIIVKQSLEPGSYIRRGAKIILELV